MTMDVGRTGGRGRSARKHEAILDSAEALFLADGYERTSVDAIAARAEVSKRTVYDHFGDKERVFSTVLERVSSGLFDAVRNALSEELPDGCEPGPALLSFARRVTTVTFASSDYVFYRRLLTVATPASDDSIAEAADPADLLLERITAFDAAGQLNAPNPRRATEHFIALTFLVALDALKVSDSAPIDEILVDGVEAFLRAYRPEDLARS